MRFKRKEKKRRLENLIDLYTDFLIVQNHYTTTTGLSNMTNREISHYISSM